MSEVCKKHAGSIGIDLTNTKSEVVNSIGIRGIWDLNTKLETARIFAIKATSDKNCKKIYFKADADLYKTLNTEMVNLKKELFSAENSLLLSNFRQKKLWVMPGEYRITISSIINEKIISVQEFSVGESTQTNVVANVK